MESNEWRHVSSLNQMHNDSLRFYLENISSNNRFDLLVKKPRKISFINQTVNFGAGILPGVSIIEVNVLPTQKEQLTFMSNPIVKPFVISGAVTASIEASVNKKDMDIMFAIYALTPEGKYIALAFNVQRASYAKDRTKRNLLKPNIKQNIGIVNTYMTSRQLRKGSRIVSCFGYK